MIREPEKECQLSRTNNSIRYDTYEIGTEAAADVVIFLPKCANIVQEIRSPLLGRMPNRFQSAGFTWFIRTGG
jgi:hypothetical protein